MIACHSVCVCMCDCVHPVLHAGFSGKTHAEILQKTQAG